MADPLELARQRFGLPLRGGALAFDLRTRQLTRLDDAPAAEALPPEMAEQVRDYLQWCRNKHQPGDCLRILRNGRVLDAHGRYAVAMAIAQSRTFEAMKASLNDMANPEAVMAMLISGMAVETVTIDTSQLNSADLAALRQALIDEGILGTKVLLYP